MSDIEEPPPSRTPFITGLTQRDGALSIRWTYVADTLNDTDETILEVYNKNTDVTTQIYLQSITNAGVRIPNLENNVEYIISIVQTLSNGEQLFSNSVSGIPRSKPSPTVQITSVDITEAPDAKFKTVIHFRLYQMLYADAIIKTVGLRLIDENKNTVNQYLIPESALLKNPPLVDPTNPQINGLVTFKEFQSFTIDTLVDGTYVASANLTNAYGTSLLSPNSTFIVQDKPNAVTDLKVLSGLNLNNSVKLQFKCIESIMTGFHITKFVIKYFKRNVPDTVMIQNVANVDSNNVPLHTQSQVINESVDVLNLDNEQEYVFSVVAVNIRGEGVTSSSVSGWAGLPDKLNNVVVNYVTNTTFSASWEVEAKNYRFKTLKYSILRDSDNVEIREGNLNVTDLSLELLNMELLDGEKVSLKLMPYIDSPLDFDPYDGMKSIDGIYSVNNVVTSPLQIVYAKANILYAISGIKHKGIQLVAKVFNSEVTSLVFEAKLKSSSSWDVLGTLDRAVLSLNGSQLFGTLNVDELALGQYDVRAKAMYGVNNDGPVTGLQGKVTSLDLPKIESVSVLKLSAELLQIKVVYDRESVPDHTVVEVYDNVDASGTALATAVLDSAGESVSNNARARTYTVSGLSLIVDTLVYVKCSVKRNVDSSYYIADNSAPVPLLESITYNSFIDSRSYYVTSQGSVTSLSGENAKNNIVVSFPYEYNSNKWDRVYKVVLEKTINNVDWVNVENIVFNATTADIRTIVVMFNVLDNTSSVSNGQFYKYRAYNVGKDIESPVLPVFSEYNYAIVKPFLASEVNSVSLTSKIDEGTNNFNVNVNWVSSEGTFVTKYDILLYSQGVLVSSALKQSASTHEFNLQVNEVCNTLGLSYSNPKNAAELLYNRSVSVHVKPFIDTLSNNLIDALSYVQKFTKIDGFLSYAGLLSSTILPLIAPYAPSDLTLISMSEYEVTIRWVKPYLTPQQVLTKYILQLSLSSTFSSSDNTLSYIIYPDNNTNSSTQTFNASELSLNTDYYPRIVAVNNLGYSNYVYGNVFKTSDSVPSIGAVTVTQNSDDGLPKVNVTFTKLTPSSYSVDNYTLSVYDGVTNSKITNDETLFANTEAAISYIFTGLFKNSYKFKVVANMTNALNEPIKSLSGESQPITICDKPKIQSILWSSNVTTSVNITVDPKGADTVNLLLLALPANNNSDVNPVFTPPTPVIGVNGLFYYIIDLPYLVNEPPKFIIVVSNIKGAVFTSNGFTSN